MAGPEVMIGKWKLTSTENFDEYMKAIGVNIVMRNLANLATPTVEFSRDDGDGTWSMTTTTTFRTVVLKFKLGEEFDEESADGRKCKTTFTWEGKTLTQKQVGVGDSAGSDITREFEGDALVTTLKAADVVCVRKYIRVTS